MLNPSVGLMVVMSSPFSLLTIVVLPALSRPLQEKDSKNGAGCSDRLLNLAVSRSTQARSAPTTRYYLHHEQPHLLLLGFDLLHYGVQAHRCLRCGVVEQHCVTAVVSSVLYECRRAYIVFERGGLHMRQSVAVHRSLEGKQAGGG